MKFQVYKITHRGDDRVEEEVGELRNSETEACIFRNSLQKLWEPNAAFDPNYVEFKVRSVSQ